jgi:hypothetical protein
MNIVNGVSVDDQASATERQDQFRSLSGLSSPILSRKLQVDGVGACFETDATAYDRRLMSGYRLVILLPVWHAPSANALCHKGLENY